MCRKIISLMVLCFWMACIFSFSAQPAEESSHLSSAVKEKIVYVIKLLFPDFQPDANDAEGNGIFTALIRKAAHFFCFFVLGILATWTFHNFWAIEKPWRWIFLFCVLYAISDELHQLFVPGRAGRVLDVFIDSSGSALGIFLFSMLKNRREPTEHPFR